MRKSSRAPRSLCRRGNAADRAGGADSPRSAELDALKNTIRISPDGALYLELKTRVQQLV